MASANTLATLAAAPQRVPFPGQMPPGGPPPGGFGGRGGGGLLLGPALPLVTTGLLLVTFTVLAVAFWMLIKKSGRSGALGLLMFVPVVNFGVMLWLAFAEWPIEAELARLKALLATRPPAEEPAETAAPPVA